MQFLESVWVSKISMHSNYPLQVLYRVCKLLQEQPIYANFAYCMKRQAESFVSQRNVWENEQRDCAMRSATGLPNLIKNCSLNER